jgi:DNA topoisomerase-3
MLLGAMPVAGLAGQAGECFGTRGAQATDAAPTTQPNSLTGTPLRIPYGNKDVAMKLGARYGSAGWYAPPGVDLSVFGERGWL